MIQQAGTLTTGTGVNSQAKVTGNSSAYLNSAFSTTNWPIFTVTIGVRANNALCGFFGHQGASGTNTLWNGYEASNSNVIYNTNSSPNTTSEAGTIAAYGAELGWGSRRTFINGVIQATYTLPSVVQSAALATSIGTQYRGLNCDWYETLVWTRPLSLSDMDELNAYLNSRYSMSIPLWSSYTGVNVVFIWGQSNASGRGNPKSYLTSPYNTAQTGVKVWTNLADYTQPLGTSWQTLDESANNNMLGDGSLASTDFGYEASIGNAYITRVGGTVYLHKYAVGGTALYNNGGGALFWLPTDNTVVPNSGLRLYSTLMNNWTAALIAFQTASQRPVMVAIVGTQGEQDATISAAASAYQANITTFYNTLRPELGTDVKGVSAPVWITRLPNGQASETYLSTVQTAQTNAAAALANANLFSTNSYSFQGDGIHFSNASYIQIGIDLARQF